MRLAVRCLGAAVAMTIISVSAVPASAFEHPPVGAIKDHVKARAITQSYDNFSTVFGIHGRAYCSPSWPAYYDWLYPSDATKAMPAQNVSAFYIRNETGIGTQMVEIGFDNDWFTWHQQGRASSGPSWIFRAFENYPRAHYTLLPEKMGLNTESLVRGQPGTWVYFEINNHAMDSTTGNWYAAWNGNTVVRGWSAPGFYRGYAEVVAERRGGKTPLRVPNVRMDSEFRYLFYKRNAQYQWAPWNGGVRTTNTDPHWTIAQLSGYSNYFRVYQNVPY